MSERFGVIGAGILGLAIARRLLELVPDATVTVLEKEPQVGFHQTGHNSGVVHAGLYYAPGSLKATLCRRGHDAPARVLRRARAAVRRVREARRRARRPGARPAGRASSSARTANAVPGLRRLSGGELREIEPHVAGVAALHSPHTAIADFAAIARAYAADVTAERGTAPARPGGERDRGARQRGAGDRGRRRGARLRPARRVRGPAVRPRRAARGRRGRPGDHPVPGRVPAAQARAADLVRGLIYPVPDPALPFLGVHFTRRVDGTVDIGPECRPGAGARGLPPQRGRAARRRRHAALARLPPAGAAALAQRRARAARLAVAPRVPARGTRVRPGVARRRRRAARPPASAPRPSTATARLVDDFRISRLGRVVAVRNAPSPAATSSLAIAEHVADLVLER